MAGPTKRAGLDHGHSQYARRNHSHDEYAAAAHSHGEYAVTAHTHDDRYYTEAEVNSSLAGKSDTGHTHAVPAWQAYTPAWTAATTNPTLGNGSISGRYQQVGKTVHFIIVLNIGSTTGLGTGTYSFSLPVAARNADEVAVVGNQGGPNAGYTGRGATTTTVALYRTATDNVANPANTAFTSGSHLRISGTYEAA